MSWKNCLNCAHEEDDMLGSNYCDGCCSRGDDPPSKWEPSVLCVRPTNGMVIRGMSNESLANWLVRLKTQCQCCALGGKECDMTDCREHILKWLEQEVSE